MHIFKRRPVSTTEPAKVEHQLYQPHYQVHETVALVERHFRPHNVRIWQQLRGDQLLGAGYVIQPDGTLRPPDAYVPSYQLELNPQGKVQPANIAQAFLECHYDFDESEAVGLMVWECLKRGELVICWFQSQATHQPRFDIVYWPATITESQYGRALALTTQLSEQFPSLMQQTVLRKHSPFWLLHDGERTDLDFCSVALPRLQHLARLAGGQLKLDCENERLVYQRALSLPGLTTLFFNCEKTAIGLIESQLMNDLAWQLSVLHQPAEG